MTGPLYALFMAFTACIMSRPLSWSDCTEAGGIFFFHFSVFAGVFSAYRLNEFLPLKNRSGPFYFLLLILPAAIAGACIFQLFTILQFAIAGILLLLYYLPFIKLKNRKHAGLRSITIIKNLIIAVCWALVTTPIIDTQPNQLSSLFIYRALFVFGLSAAIDIKDLREDQKNNHLTIPVTIGVEKTKMLSILSICLGGILFALIYRGDILQVKIVAAHSLITAFGIGWIREKSNKINTVSIVDGNLFIHAIIFLLLYFKSPI